MMSDRDMTFCLAADNCKVALQGDCHRYFNEDHRERARKWAESSGMSSTPVAWSDFSKSCSYYQPVDPEWKRRMFDSD